MSRSLLTLIIATFASIPFGHAATKYNLDVSHSAVQFKVAHLMISTVSGRFDKFEGSFQYDTQKSLLSDLSAKIDLDTVDTDNEKRDGHLKNDDFFGIRDKKGKLVPKKQFMSFSVDKPVKIKPGAKKKLKGKLTLNGITKEIELEVHFRGMAKDPWGNQRIGFEAEGKLSRKEFGLTYNKVMETGGVVIGDEIEIEINGEAIAQK